MNSIDHKCAISLIFSTERVTLQSIYFGLDMTYQVDFD